ncbi:MAG: DUF2298 domain-containing protein [Anaerolineae bacterium]
MFVWWLLIQILGLAALPLAYRIFRWVPGRGYAFVKPLGLLMTSFILWIGTSLGYLRNTVSGILVAISMTAGISLWFYFRQTEEGDQHLLSFLSEHRDMVLVVEAMFAAGLACWAVLRAYAPDKIMSSGGEKFMEIAFLNAILRSPTFPPHDPWLSSFAISYYHFGYVMMALLTRLSGVASGVGFDLYDALLFALTATGAFGVVYGLVAGHKPADSSDGAALRCGALASLFVAVMGNLEGVLEAVYAKGILPDAFWQWMDIPDLVQAGRVTGSWYPGHGWWWWRASRVIRDRNLLGEPMPLNPIDEFPFFSFLLGDNHPHVLALPFALLAIGLAYNLLRRQWCTSSGVQSQAMWWNPVRQAFDGDWSLFVGYAVALGALGFLNTWDFPIYAALTVLAYGLGRRACTGESLGLVLRQMVVLGMSLTLAGVVLYFPFYVSFSSQAGGVLPYLLPPTRLAQYLVMFGPFIFVAAWFLLAKLLTKGDTDGALISAMRSWAVVAAVPLVVLILATSLAVAAKPGRQFIQGVLSDPQIQQIVGSAGAGPALKAIALARLRDPWLFLTLSLLIGVATVHVLRPGRRRSRSHHFAPSEQFAALLFVCGLGLTFTVEFVYLRDTFGVRMNTIFKFYYQAWVMLGCASAYGVWWVLSRPGTRPSATVRKAFLGGTALLTAATMVYPAMATFSRAEGFRNPPNLNGTVNVARNHPDDWAAIDWLRSHARGTPVILEAPGRSYNYEGRISAFTGYPAVLGWALHESQWRGSYVEQGKREPDIKAIYTAKSNQQALDLLRKWDVDIVVVGQPERRYVEELCSESDRQCEPGQALMKFRRFLDPVFEQGQTTLYRVPES